MSMKSVSRVPSLAQRLRPVHWMMNNNEAEQSVVDNLVIYRETWIYHAYDSNMYIVTRLYMVKGSLKWGFSRHWNWSGLH